MKRRTIFTALALIVFAVYARLEYCGPVLQYYSILALEEDEPQAQDAAKGLRRALCLCPVPRDGLVSGFNYSEHAAELYLIGGDVDAAIDALQSEKYTLTDEQRFQILTVAASRKSVNALQAVLDAGIDATLQADDGYTALFSAASSGPYAVERMTLLVERGVDPMAEIERPVGGTALMAAIYNDNNDAITRLLEWFAERGPAGVRLVQHAVVSAHIDWDLSVAQFGTLLADSMPDIDNENRVSQFREWIDDQVRPAIYELESCDSDLEFVHFQHPSFVHWTQNTFAGTAKLEVIVEPDGTTLYPRVMETSDWSPVDTILKQPVGYEDAILASAWEYRFSPVPARCVATVSLDIGRDDWFGHSPNYLRR